MGFRRGSLVDGHIINIIRLPTSQEYHADAAFGGDGATSPLPLRSGQITQNLGTQQVRLVYDNIPKQTRPEHKVWIYQYCNGVEKPWNSFYSFAELEWFRNDFEVINRFPSWDAVQKGSFVVVRFLRNGEIGDVEFLEGEGARHEGDGEVFVVGKAMIVNNVVKVNMGGRTRVVDSFEGDEGRFKALRRRFNISLDQEI